MTSNPKSPREQPPDMIEIAAVEASSAHRETSEILKLLREGSGEIDPLAAMIDMMEIMNNKLDELLRRLPPTPPTPAERA